MKAEAIVTGLLVVLICGSVQAQETTTPGCAAPDLDARIAACSTLISKGGGATSDFSIVFNNRGLAYAGKGEFDSAILDYNEAISLNPYFALAYSNRGVAFEAKGSFERAIEDYNKAIDLSPDFRPAFNNRCYALAELGRPEQALDDCNKAIKLQSGDAKALDSRGYVYFLLGRYADAIHDLDAALELDSKMPTAFYLRGLAKLELGDPRGETDVEQARRLDKTISDTMAKIGVRQRTFIPS